MDLHGSSGTHFWRVNVYPHFCNVEVDEITAEKCLLGVPFQPSKRRLRVTVSLGPLSCRRWWPFTYTDDRG
jgi:hypothetical protein